MTFVTELLDSPAHGTPSARYVEFVIFSTTEPYQTTTPTPETAKR